MLPKLRDKASQSESGVKYVMYYRQETANYRQDSAS